METSFVLIQASVVFNQQISLFDEYQEDTKEGRNKVFRQIFEEIIGKKSVKYVSSNIEQILLYKCRFSNDLLFMQLANHKRVETYQLNQNDILPVPVDSYPPLNVFVNLAKQQIAVELKTNVLSIDAITRAFSNIVRRQVKNCIVYFNTIDNVADFWGVVNRQGEVQEITFEMTVPNYFGASDDAKDLVDGAKDNLNADSVSLSFKNKNGKLNANITAIDSYVKYSSGAGIWKLRIKSPGDSRYKVIRSSDYSIKKSIDSEIIDLVKEMDSEGNIDIQYFNLLLSRIEELFEDE